MIPVSAYVSKPLKVFPPQNLPWPRFLHSYHFLSLPAFATKPEESWMHTCSLQFFTRFHLKSTQTRFGFSETFLVKVPMTLALLTPPSAPRHRRHLIHEAPLCDTLPGHRPPHPSPAAWPFLHSAKAAQPWAAPNSSSVSVFTILGISCSLSLWSDTGFIF